MKVVILKDCVINKEKYQAGQQVVLPTEKATKLVMAGKARFISIRDVVMNPAKSLYGKIIKK